VYFAGYRLAVPEFSAQQLNQFVGTHALVRFADRGINPGAGKSSPDAADGAAMRLPSFLLLRPVRVFARRLSPGRTESSTQQLSWFTGFRALVRFADRGINPGAGKSSPDAADGAAMQSPGLVLPRPVRALAGYRLAAPESSAQQLNLPVPVHSSGLPTAG
jgi:hypothetical protein